VPKPKLRSTPQSEAPERRGSGTRGRIVEHAMRLFWERGYERTAISDIIAAAGVRSGSLYHFFKTKEEVLIAVLEAYLDGLAPQVMDPAFAVTTDPVGRVFAVMDRGLSPGN